MNLSISEQKMSILLSFIMVFSMIGLVANPTAASPSPSVEPTNNISPNIDDEEITQTEFSSEVNDLEIGEFTQDGIFNPDQINVEHTGDGAYRFDFVIAGCVPNRNSADKTCAEDVQTLPVDHPISVDVSLNSGRELDNTSQTVFISPNSFGVPRTSSEDLHDGVEPGYIQPVVGFIQVADENVSNATINVEVTQNAEENPFVTESITAESSENFVVGNHANDTEITLDRSILTTEGFRNPAGVATPDSYKDRDTERESFFHDVSLPSNNSLEGTVRQFQNLTDISESTIIEPSESSVFSTTFSFDNIQRNNAYSKTIQYQSGNPIQSNIIDRQGEILQEEVLPSEPEGQECITQEETEENICLFELNEDVGEELQDNREIFVEYSGQDGAEFMCTTIVSGTFEDPELETCGVVVFDSPTTQNPNISQFEVREERSGGDILWRDEELRVDLGTAVEFRTEIQNLGEDDISFEPIELYKGNIEEDETQISTQTINNISEDEEYNISLIDDNGDPISPFNSSLRVEADTSGGVIQITITDGEEEIVETTSNRDGSFDIPLSAFQQGDELTIDVAKQSSLGDEGEEPTVDSIALIRDEIIPEEDAELIWSGEVDLLQGNDSEEINIRQQDSEFEFERGRHDIQLQFAGETDEVTVIVEPDASIDMEIIGPDEVALEPQTDNNGTFITETIEVGTEQVVETNCPANPAQDDCEGEEDWEVVDTNVGGDLGIERSFESILLNEEEFDVEIGDPLTRQELEIIVNESDRYNNIEDQLPSSEGNWTLIESELAGEADERNFIATENVNELLFRPQDIIRTSLEGYDFAFLNPDDSIRNPDLFQIRDRDGELDQYGIDTVREPSSEEFEDFNIEEEVLETVIAPDIVGERPWEDLNPATEEEDWERGELQFTTEREEDGEVAYICDSATPSNGEIVQPETIENVDEEPNVEDIVEADGNLDTVEKVEECAGINGEDGQDWVNIYEVSSEETIEYYEWNFTVEFTPLLHKNPNDNVDNVQRYNSSRYNIETRWTTDPNPEEDQLRLYEGPETVEEVLVEPEGHGYYLDVDVTGPDEIDEIDWNIEGQGSSLIQNTVSESEQTISLSAESISENTFEATISTSDEIDVPVEDYNGDIVFPVNYDFTELEIELEDDFEQGVLNIQDDSIPEEFSDPTDGITSDDGEGITLESGIENPIDLPEERSTDEFRFVFTDMDSLDESDEIDFEVQLTHEERTEEFVHATFENTGTFEIESTVTTEEQNLTATETKEIEVLDIQDTVLEPTMRVNRSSEFIIYEEDHAFVELQLNGQEFRPEEISDKEYQIHMDDIGSGVVGDNPDRGDMCGTGRNSIILDIMEEPPSIDSEEQFISINPREDNDIVEPQSGESYLYDNLTFVLCEVDTSGDGVDRTILGGENNVEFTVKSREDDDEGGGSIPGSPLDDSGATAFSDSFEETIARSNHIRTLPDPEHPEAVVNLSTVRSDQKQGISLGYPIDSNQSEVGELENPVTGETTTPGSPDGTDLLLYTPFNAQYISINPRGQFEEDVIGVDIQLIVDSELVHDTPDDEVVVPDRPQNSKDNLVMQTHRDEILRAHKEADDDTSEEELISMYEEFGRLNENPQQIRSYDGPGSEFSDAELFDGTRVHEIPQLVQQQYINDHMITNDRDNGLTMSFYMKHDDGPQNPWARTESEIIDSSLFELNDAYTSGDTELQSDLGDELVFGNEDGELPDELPLLRQVHLSDEIRSRSMSTLPSENLVHIFSFNTRDGAERTIPRGDVDSSEEFPREMFEASFQSTGYFVQNAYTGDHSFTLGPDSSETTSGMLFRGSRSESDLFVSILNPDVEGGSFGQRSDVPMWVTSLRETDEGINAMYGTLLEGYEGFPDEEGDDSLLRSELTAELAKLRSDIQQDEDGNTINHVIDPNDPFDTMLMFGTAHDMRVAGTEDGNLTDYGSASLRGFAVSEPFAKEVFRIGDEGPLNLENWIPQFDQFYELPNSTEGNTPLIVEPASSGDLDYINSTGAGQNTALSVPTNTTEAGGGATRAYFPTEEMFQNREPTQSELHDEQEFIDLKTDTRLRRDSGFEESRDWNHIAISFENISGLSMPEERENQYMEPVLYIDGIRYDSKAIDADMGLIHPDSEPDEETGLEDVYEPERFSTMPFGPDQDADDFDFTSVIAIGGKPAPFHAEGSQTTPAAGFPDSDPSNSSNTQYGAYGNMLSGMKISDLRLYDESLGSNNLDVEDIMIDVGEAEFEDFINPSGQIGETIERPGFEEETTNTLEDALGEDGTIPEVGQVDFREFQINPDMTEADLTKSRLTLQPTEADGDNIVNVNTNEQQMIRDSHLQNDKFNTAEFAFELAESAGVEFNDLELEETSQIGYTPNEIAEEIQTAEGGVSGGFELQDEAQRYVEDQVHLYMEGEMSRPVLENRLNTYITSETADVGATTVNLIERIEQEHVEFYHMIAVVHQLDALNEDVNIEEDDFNIGGFNIADHGYHNIRSINLDKETSLGPGSGGTQSSGVDNLTVLSNAFIDEGSSDMDDIVIAFNDLDSFDRVQLTRFEEDYFDGFFENRNYIDMDTSYDLYVEMMNPPKNYDDAKQIRSLQFGLESTRVTEYLERIEEQQTDSE